ncbi:ribosome biogenesis GTPase Der [Candidatus Saccharibacteria bacterium]|nr:ribosome biogenesis GTPase Der [Candidatus Saccharibacteria bacterium]NIV03162.1 ribosome biogenesis GTPase Der [Calditrichia bacterium]NIS37679.1 ribosome biogenesis GTPase Der [Candidatus Saccharibacteria bacterium]NIV71268.1 ribosome biogenesis GTPase Der [Calditrichia bacterium]NIV97743.1 ribosome biogenesis GTPase Der [Candidatus Saccharibacteria bacterium]
MTTNTKKPLIAIVGRTNVGKSTLFNTLAEENKAMVSAIPGTTRDRAFADCVWRGKLIQVIDTGGFERKKSAKGGSASGGITAIEKGIKEQIQIALDEADLVFFLVNIRDGVLAEDLDFARELRKIKKPIIFIANKADKKDLMLRAKDPEWKKLGFGEPVPISATTGIGVGDLLEDAYAEFKKLKLEPQPAEKIDALKVAIIGKPNAGKSSLVNALCDEPRMIVSDIAFTTREPQDTFISYKDKNYLLIDTAGLRKRAKIKKGLEKIGTERTREILEDADIILLVLDISESLGTQDKNLADLAVKSEKGLIIIANKWDLIKNKTPKSPKEFTNYILSRLNFIFWAPILFISAKDKKNTPKIFGLIEDVQKERKREITHNALDKFLKSAIKRAKPIGGTGMTTAPYIHTMKQTGTKPPSFEVVVKTKHVLHGNYLKYLEKQLREKFGFAGTPVIIKSRSRK